MKNNGLLKIEQKVIYKKNKIDQYNAACKKCSSEIKILRKELKKSSSSPKVEKMLAKWLSQKDKLTSKVHKLKEDCKEHNMKLKEMKTKMRKKHMKKGGSVSSNPLGVLYGNKAPLYTRQQNGKQKITKSYDTLTKRCITKNPNKALANSHLPITVLTDSYKLGHPQMYPEEAIEMIAYGEFRGPMVIEDKSGKKNVGDDRIVVMGLEYIIENYINRTWCKADIDETVDFFNTHAPGGSPYQFPAEEFYAIAGYKYDKITKNVTFEPSYVEKFKGKIPITVEGLPDGSVVLPHTPVYKITAKKDTNNDINFSKLITFFETILTMVWYPSCVATLSRHCKQIIENAYINTGLATGYYTKNELQSSETGTLYHNSITPLLDSQTIDSQPKDKLTIHDYIKNLAATGGIDGTIKISMHDFGFRGATTVEQSMLGGMAHLLNFDGTDTMSAAYKAFKANNKKYLGVSIPATEHSVMTSYKFEKDAIKNMFEKYINPEEPFSIFAMVMDSYDYTRALFKELPLALKEYDTNFTFGNPNLKKLEEGRYKVVLRPDSGESKEVVLLGLVAACAIFGFNTYNINGKIYIQCKNSGVIQGDGINVFTLQDILETLTGTGTHSQDANLSEILITNKTDSNTSAKTLDEYLTLIINTTQNEKDVSHPEVRFWKKEIDTQKFTTVTENIENILEKEVKKVMTSLQSGAHFTPDCMAFGMGGGLLQKVNRDTMQFATKLCSSKQQIKISGVSTPKLENVIVMKNPATSAEKRSIPGDMDVIKTTGPLPFKVVSKEIINREETIKDKDNKLNNYIQFKDKDNETGVSMLTLKYENGTFTKPNNNFSKKRGDVNEGWFKLKDYAEAKKTSGKDKLGKFFGDDSNSPFFDGTQKAHFSKQLNWMQQFYDPSVKRFVMPPGQTFSGGNRRIRSKGGSSSARKTNKKI